MGELLGLLFSTALINNLALTHLISLDLQVAASRRIDAAWLIGLATTYCLTFLLPIIYIIQQLFIIPFELQFIDLLINVMVIIIFVLSSQKVMHRLFPLIYQQVDALVPILLINPVLLAVILLQQGVSSFSGSIFYGLFTGIGFLFLLLVITCLRERIDNEKVPVVFRGIPILLISLGLFSMGLMGLAGLE